MATDGRNQNPYLQVPGAKPPSSNGVSTSPTSSTSNVAQNVSALSSTASNLAASSSGTAAPGTNTNPSAFRAPAHKHAHHLHSIPPREKSTRTLIIDYMLWVHGRTRFAQARAELGMTDRTGGPGTPQYAHRQRPENYEEEEDYGSDGEDPVTLKARAGDPGRPHNDDEDDRLRSQDLSLARALRLRAEGVEKVITSMLDQAPPPHPVLAEELLTPPTSPRIQPAKTPGPHAIPNGVRLRLSLGTMINDLFARQAPIPPHRHRRQTSVSSPVVPVASPAPVADPGLPMALKAIATVSASCPDTPSVQPWTVPSSSLRPGPGPLYPVQPRSPPMANARTRTLYNAGADPSTANSPPAFRCPRHLHTGCEICVEAKSTPRGSNRGRTTSFGGDANGVGRTQYWKGMPGGVSPEGGGITGWLDGSGIGSGLLRPKSSGTVLRRKTKDIFESGDGNGPQNGAGNTKLSELVPRFIRLSAMVAMEMGREARGEEEEPAQEEKEDGEEDSPMSKGWEGPAPEMEPLPPPATPVPASPEAAMYASALLPSREWYLLLAGLLTRAVLEGYLTAGWQGPDAVDCLLKVGLGKQSPLPDDLDDETDEFSEFDPDELPSLLDATKMLFPALRDGNKQMKGQAEEEYENEMETRLRRFYDIPQATPDLSTHMEDLAWQYPAEPVERAAVRFCEAIEKWRGKPELETYKKKPPASSTPMVLDTPSSLDPLQSPANSAHTPSIGGIPMSVPPPPRSHRKPSIQVYFPTPFPLPRWSSSPAVAVASGSRSPQQPRAKRLRSPGPDGDDGRTSPAKVARAEA
ncbi:hypothetical protein HMN09_00747800 [Mycena chlorophos]|uniref:Uncharacterized protein n=1 Tax=Mycena chlorophos TaxID=658473 RepID=A0A8H6SWF6_MYCCL|nr:hypothetical protein HMN09_00747800 [Mycena chlorophos]